MQPVEFLGLAKLLVGLEPKPQAVVRTTVGADEVKAALPKVARIQHLEFHEVAPLAQCDRFHLVFIECPRAFYREAVQFLVVDGHRCLIVAANPQVQIVAVGVHVYVTSGIVSTGC